MNETTTKTGKPVSKKTSIFIIAGGIAFIAMVFFAGSIGEQAEKRVVDAESTNIELQAEVDELQSQLNSTITILAGHENLLRQHDLQIQTIANNTNIIAGWAEAFSVNVDERVTALEEGQ